MDEEERDNFFCMTLLLFRVGNEKLREFFKTQWPIVYQNKTGTSPPAPWTDVPNDAKEMRKVHPSLKFQFKNQKTQFDSGNTKTWDFTLLAKVLNDSTLGFVTASSPEDQAIKELKEIRNTLIGHAADAKIPDTVYNTEWPKACNALKTFKATQDEIDQVVEDVKLKPVKVLLLIVKECVNLEKEILNGLYELEKSNEIRHNETLAALNEGNEDIKEAMNIGFEQVKDVIKACTEPKVNQDPKQRIFIEKRLNHFQKNVTASELFNFLPCLPDEKRESIKHLERISKPIQAVRDLVWFLEEKGDTGLQMLVNALAQAGYQQAALLLDPDFEDHMIRERDVSANTEEKMYTVIAGTAVDIFVTLRFMDDQRRLLELEQKISEQFNKQQLPQTKKLRRDFIKVLPKGVYFVETKDLEEMQADINTTEDGASSSGHGNISDSVVVVLRVAKARALEELWECRLGLKEKLRRVLVENVVLGGANSDNLQNCKMEMVFEENDYLSARTTLKDLESQNETAILNASAGGPMQSTAHNKERFICKDVPPVYLSDGNESHEIVLRDYQKELAAPAFEGKNTVICAPTNSGKTFVAMEIAKRHFDAHRDTPCKVIFVVDKQNLILQQRLRFQRFLHQHRISDICSYNSSKASLEELLKSNDVVVLTAQILVNALESGKVKITELSLLLFDECHHTDKNHSFRQIMKFYLDEKLQETPRESLPQVVGFTASLGVGQSKTIEGAVDHILQVCANHDALIIKTVHENIDDLEKCVTAGVAKTIVKRVIDDFPNIFEKKVNEAMRKIESSMDGNDPPHSERHLEDYRQWIELMENDFKIERNRENVVYTTHLRRYHEALLLNYTTTINDALKLLREFSDSLEDSMFTESTRWLKKLPLQIENDVNENINKFGKPANPLLEALKEKIVEFHGKFKDSGVAKGIVFTRKRQYTVALSSWIKEMSELENISLKPEVLVGSGDGDVGFTLPQQRAVIERFKTGDVNIIIATSVAHEGLDIADCNYAISYDMLDSEISSVQSRGRIRAKDGTYVRIVGSRSRSDENEQKVKRNEEMMNQAMTIVQGLSREKMLAKVSRLQREYAMSRKVEEEQELAKLQAAPGVKLNCGDCNSFICLTDNMRRYKGSNNLVVNPDIFSRIVMKERDNKNSQKKSRFNLKVHCKECLKDLGVVLLTNGTTQWPCLKIESFIVVLEDGERSKYSKWGKAPFKLQEATLEELYRAREALTKSFEGNQCDTVHTN